MLDPNRIRMLAAEMDEDEVPPMSAEQAEQVARLLTADSPITGTARELIPRVLGRMGGMAAAVLLTGAGMSAAEFVTYRHTEFTTLLGGLVIS